MAFNFQALLQGLAQNGVDGNGQDPYGGLGQLVQQLTGRSNIPSGNPLSPVQQPSSAPAPVIAPNAPQADDIDPRTIVASARNVAPAETEPSAPPNMGNRDFLDEAANASKNAPQRKGMFGTRGTLRDILGTLGDAFLVQSGNKAVYAPHRQAERESDQLAGFTQDPLAAIERLASGGNAPAAMDLSKEYNTDQVRRLTAGQASKQAAEANYQKYGSLFGQYIGATTPKTYERIKPILQQLKARGQLGDEFSIPDTYDQAMNKSYQMGGMNTTNQIRTGQAEETATERARHNRATEENGRISATKQPAPRNPPQPTKASIAAPIVAKSLRGEKLTPQEQDVLDRTAPLPARRGSALERMMSGGGGNSASKPHTGFTVTRQ